MIMKPLSSKINIDELAVLFGLPAFDTVDDMNIDYYAAVGDAARRACEDNTPEAKVEVAIEAAETEARDEIFHKWYGAVLRAVEPILEKHGLVLNPCSTKEEYPYEFRLAPAVSWRSAADRVRQTINGVGMFEFNTLREFLSSGPYTARAAVLEHTHWIPRWSEVYGEDSARTRYNRAWR
jgi:hypothetical protein